MSDGIEAKTDSEMCTKTKNKAEAKYACKINKEKQMRY